MYPVSADYKTAMRKGVRQGRAQARIYLGVFDKTAASDASLSFSVQTPYADPEVVNTQSALTPGYVTFEPKQFRLDGSQYLLPDNAAAWSGQAFTSNVQSDADGVFQSAPFVGVDFSIPHSIVGLTLSFDPAFDLPAQMTVVAYAGGAEKSRNVLTDIGSAIYRKELFLENVDRILLLFDRTRNAYGRARLNRIEFGIGYVYGDNDIISISDSHTESPVVLELPSDTLTFELWNEDRRFNVDVDTDLQKFLADGQDVSVDYAYLDDDWTQEIPGGKWRLNEWSADSKTAKFKSVNILANLNNSMYNKGKYDGKEHTLYDLALDVLNDAGIDAGYYYVGPYLKQTKTKAPIPMVSHATALQLIANAARARLFVSRDGKISFETTIESDPVASSSTAQLPYSDAASVVSSGNVEYATFEPEFFTVSGSQYLVPDSGFKSAGWVVDGVSGPDLKYPDNEIVLTYEAPTNVFSIEIDWGGSYPATFQVEGREDGIWGSPVTLNASRMTERYAVQFTHIDAIRMKLVDAQKPGIRPRVRRVKTSMLSDFTLYDDQIFDSPKGSLGPKLRRVTTAWVSFTPGTETEEIQTYDAETNTGWVAIEHDLAYELRASATGGAVVEEEHYAYISFVRLSSASKSPVTVTLTGRKVTEVSHDVESVANPTGEDLPIENPLFGSESVATAVADWVRDYYAGRVTYKNSVRGFPELDCGDTIYLEGDTPARITGLNNTYNGAFRTTISLRR